MCDIIRFLYGVFMVCGCRIHVCLSFQVLLSERNSQKLFMTKQQFLLFLNSCVTYILVIEM